MHTDSVVSLGVSRTAQASRIPRLHFLSHELVRGITDRAGVVDAIDRLRGFSRPERIAVVVVHAEACCGAGGMPAMERGAPPAVPELLRRSVRATDVVGRIDDERYCVVGGGALPGVSAGLPSRIRQVLTSSPRLSGVEVSVGFVTLLPDEDAEVALARALHALHEDQLVRSLRRDAVRVRVHSVAG